MSRRTRYLATIDAQGIRVMLDASPSRPTISLERCKHRIYIDPDVAQPLADELQAWAEGGRKSLNPRFKVIDRRGVAVHLAMPSSKAVVVTSGRDRVALDSMSAPLVAAALNAWIAAGYRPPATPIPDHVPTQQRHAWDRLAVQPSQ